jgi:hypothetical protein
MDLINFLIIGDHKAATSSLYHYLRQHPDVYMPQEMKELRFFAYDSDNPYHRVAKSKSYPVKILEHYQQFFPSHIDVKARGEASPNYLRSPVAAKNIHSMFPHTKLIVSLRNPADRLVSAYLMRYRNGGTKKTLVEELFGEDAGRVKMSFYWPDLIRFYELFDHKQIKVILFDDIKADPSSVMRDLFRFLDVNDEFSPASFDIHHKGGMPKNQAIYSLLVKAKNKLKPIVDFSQILRPLFKVMCEKVKKGSLETIELDEQISKKILEICHSDIIRTQDLIGRDLSCWLKSGE